MHLKPLTLLAALSGLQTVSSLRHVMYIDQYHTTDLPSSNTTAAMNISHVVMAFAKSTLFNKPTPDSYEPFEPVEQMRARFTPDTKLMVAIGGWGDTEGFSDGAKDEDSRKQYASNVAAMLEAHGFDGVDIDWEYPGGNGDDYKKVPNSEKKGEIETYPLFLEAVKEAIGEKILSIATPGKKGDMIAFTKEQGPRICGAADMMNAMTYDLMNRRNNVTKHHSSIEESLSTIRAYEDIGCKPEQLNLGFAFYTKWFTTQKDAGCEEEPLGCPVVELEDEKGGDTGKSGVLTFEKGTMASPEGELEESTDMTCGFGVGKKCPEGTCCSQYGNCGTGQEFCYSGCLSDYGECKGISIVDSWRRAQENGQTDEEAGGQYYFDEEVDLFWSWDTPELIGRKFKEIVDEEKLGGVMGWSLGEDTLNFEHVEALAKGVEERS